MWAKNSYGEVREWQRIPKQISRPLSEISGNPERKKYYPVCAGEKRQSTTRQQDHHPESENDDAKSLPLRL
jgi:hypothetical protein